MGKPKIHREGLEANSEEREDAHGLTGAECPGGAGAVLEGPWGIKEHPPNGSRQHLCLVQPGEAGG